MECRILYLFPDTNLFIQCKPLEQLDWSALEEFTEIRLLVCRPVQREIDGLKNRGRDRTADRARRTNTLFRDVLSTADRQHMIRESSPRVTLSFSPIQLPSKDLKDRLDFNHTDDELLGFLYEFCQAHPGEDARLLTHDTGPMATAENLGMTFLAIRNEWLLPPENNPKEKENQQLKNEITRLKSLEPAFGIECLSPEAQPLDRLESECEIYLPLGEEEIEELLALLMKRYPMVTNFGREATSDKPSKVDINQVHVNSLARSLSTPRPPSDQEISEYKNRRYPRWLQSCRDLLTNLHRGLQWETGWPTVCFPIVNLGTRPARDALIEWRAQGNFKLLPPKEDFPEWHVKEQPGLQLPAPPAPPRGRSIRELMANAVLPLEAPVIAPRSLLPHSEVDRDPNGFYYKPSFQFDPQSSISLSCNQWRHSQGPIEFQVQLCFGIDNTMARGLLECVVQAENLTDPEIKRLPVRIAVKRIDTMGYARQLILGESSVQEGIP